VLKQVPIREFLIIPIVFVRLAKRNGYEKITLWTNSVLSAARHIYEKVGFRVVKEKNITASGRT
jgi:ribosomal protein S18 acetylase RimI-like enzyme